MGLVGEGFENARIVIVMIDRLMAKKTAKTKFARQNPRLRKKEQVMKRIIMKTSEVKCKVFVENYGK